MGPAGKIGMPAGPGILMFIWELVLFCATSRDGIKDEHVKLQ